MILLLVTYFSAHSSRVTVSSGCKTFIISLANCSSYTLKISEDSGMLSNIHDVSVEIKTNLSNIDNVEFQRVLLL